MGLLDGMLGNASEIEPKEAQEKLKDMLGDNEEVTLSYKVIRDRFIFTNNTTYLN